MKLNSKRGKGKKGISPLIGYVLLVVFAIVISSIVFQWLRTYIPAEAMKCPDGVSLFINNATFDITADGGELSVTMTNNGRFIIDGYFINIKNDSEQDLAIIGISKFLDEEKSGAIEISGYVLIGSDENPFEPQDQATHIFDIPGAYGKPYSVSIIPIRQQEYKGRERFVSCGNARVEEVIGEPGTGSGEEGYCGDGTCDSGECTAGCIDCHVSDCCGVDGCNEGIGETCSNCEEDCGECEGCQDITVYCYREYGWDVPSKTDGDDKCEANQEGTHWCTKSEIQNNNPIAGGNIGPRNCGTRVTIYTPDEDGCSGGIKCSVDGSSIYGSDCSWNGICENRFCSREGILCCPD